MWRNGVILVMLVRIVGAKDTYLREASLVQCKSAIRADSSRYLGTSSKDIQKQKIHPRSRGLLHKAAWNLSYNRPRVFYSNRGVSATMGVEISHTHAYRFIKTKAFTSAVFKRLCQLLFIAKTQTTSLHPQSEVAYCSAVHEITGCIPSQKLFGRELRFSLISYSLARIVYAP